MGFELIYSYHEKKEGEYNKEETKTKKKKVGDPFEDVPLEKLASEIIKLMARRDIFVVGFEIFELAKKEVSFREAKGGIVIKNKKFLFDDDNNTLTVQEVPASLPQPMPVDYPQHVSVVGQAPQPTLAQPVQPHNQGQLRPVKWMIFAPELPMMPEVKQKGLRFTPDKKYPVFQVQPHPTGIGEVYKMVDDTGREQLVSDKYFVPGEPVLFADKELRFSETAAQRDGGKLYWGSAASEPDMPVLRRR